MLLAKTLGMSAHERTLTRYDLLAADEVFLTGSGAGLVPIASLDGQPVARGDPDSVLGPLRALTRDYARQHGVPFISVPGQLARLGRRFTG